MNNIFKRISSLLLAAVTMLSLAGAAFADNVVHMVHIRSADDLVELAQSCTLDTRSQGVTVRLDADISLDGVDFAPIPSFGGTFNGNGHTISGLNISGKYSRAGLFAEIQESGTVKNLNVSGTVDISGTTTATGGIAGVNYGKIISCTFTGSVSGSVDVGAIAGRNELSGTIQNCAVTGAVHGNKMTGGVAGYNAGLIASCRNSAYINTVSEDKTFSIQDITIDTTLDIARLSSRDTLSSASDTGGVAGYSAGIIRRCLNDAVIGYRHVGYNVGGIAGRSCGFISGCTNSGTVYGRKDVGGVVGQMEPYIEMNVENSALAKMQQQLDELSALIDQTANDVQGISGTVSSRLAGISGYIGGALGEIGNLDTGIGGGQIGDGTFPGFDVVTTPDLSGLVAVINGIGSQLSMLNWEISGATGAVANDVRAVNEKFNELSNTMFDAVFSAGSEGGDILRDTSGIDIDIVKLGKVSSSANTGAVSGDINIGGVAGAMAIEYESDPEDDVTSNISARYKREYELKAVLQDCTNKGSVTARRSYAGGVAGRMDLGIITGCCGFGDVASESGDYVGGVAGLVSAAMRTCWAKCTVSGGKYVGGIAGSGVEEAVTGSGSTVTGCVSMVEIAEAAQYYGAISGSDLGEYLENYFVSDSLPGIDGRSISGKAEPISYETLMAIDTLPDEFKAMRLSFVADGKTLKTVTFNYGDSFGSDVYPEIPEKDGYYAKWDRTELDGLRFDTVVTADYELEYSALPSDEQRGDTRPVFFIEGKYGDDDVLSSSLEAEAELAPLDSELTTAVSGDSTPRLPWLARLTAPISGGIIEQRHVTIPDDGQNVHTLHYLPPEVAIGELNIYIMQDGRWIQAKTEGFGSYLAFDVAGTEADIAAVPVISVWWIWAAIAAVALTVILLVVFSIKRRRREHSKTAEKKTKTPAVRAESVPKPDKKRRKNPAAVIITLLLICALGAAAAVFVPQLVVKLAPYKALMEFGRADELSMNVSVEAALGDERISTVVPVAVKRSGENSITCAVVENVPLYYSNAMLILENGKSYSISSMFPDYSSLLGKITALYKDVEYTEDDSACMVSISGAQAAELLQTLCPALSGETETVNSAAVETVIENGSVQSITVSASGESSGSAFEVCAVISGMKTSSDAVIPEAVAEAAAQNSAENLPEISGDLFRIISAWAELDGRDSIAAKLKMAVNCGSVVLDTTLDVDSAVTNGKRIYCVGKNNLKLYTDGSSVVNASGAGVTDEEAQLAGNVNLLNLVYQACLNGNISAAQTADGYTYTVALDGDGVKQLLEIISPDAAKLNPNLAYGDIKLYIGAERITGISVSCTGTVQVVVVEAPVSVSADVSFEERSTAKFPSAVTDKLSPA